ncbi:hypothetical protein MUK70_18535 [Dyadobacter chenwenxiniae]|uniref:Uncharacterized protein n=1 Tax=Dyadobacter chenwenxiniae TaxID=2906456 RepID=A0A9X1TCU8_9BACT|nr:hypothetical protein [Dyadobacter chenwenxiniae]MCF0061241.1 hypothetical protein [Dyadobacter chenwenxiniae]UON81063.1 hypothetical protein MUK70_18535 [Dyadobacter chenwenxiniae]
MKVLEKQSGKGKKSFTGTYDSALDNLPVPQIVLDKTERGHESLKKHPLPQHLLRK